MSTINRRNKINNHRETKIKQLEIRFLRNFHLHCTSTDNVEYPLIYNTVGNQNDVVAMYGIYCGSYVIV